jgi:molecular chaperone DnaK
MYKQAAEQEGGPGGPGTGAGAGEGKKEDVVDAEFTEVDDDKKKSA